VTLAPRLAVGLCGEWENTVVELPEGNWENVFSGERFSGGKRELSWLLSQFPVALLVKD
jgi:(1->4)-alpha-D-glucan 1-alpha-D-glucosylmutase